MHQKASAPLKKSTVILCLALIAILAFLIRCLHLLNPDHYYIISVDSHFFHWMAELTQSGHTVDYPFLGHTVPTIWHTGITYPLAYMAKAIGFVFGMSPVDALSFTSKFLPPTLAILSIVVIYLAVCRIYNQRVALFSAFAWAILAPGIFVQGAGYLDRDGLSILLLMIGAFIFYLSRDWHWKIGRLDLGWVAGGLAVIAIEALLLLEWIWVGPVLLLAILTAFFVAEVLARFLIYVAPSLMEMAEIPVLARKSLTGISTALRESNWRPFALIAGLSALMGAISPGFPYMYRLATSIVREALSPAVGGVPVAEMQGLGLGDLIGYGFLTIPLGIGLLIMLANHRRVDLFLLLWFAALFFLGLFAKRVFLYAAPAGCIIAGLGLAFVWHLDEHQLLRRYIQKSVLRYMRIGAIIVLLLLLLFLSSFWGYIIGSGRMAAANDNWQDALTYLRDSSPEEAVIMSWWDYGYWILDLAERRPVVDNGYYGYNLERLQDVGLAYCTTEPSEAVQMMEKYGADYLVFSRLEEDIFGGIAEFGLGEEYRDSDSIVEKLQDSLYVRALSGDIQSGQGLGVAYRNDEVVILRLE